MSAPFGQRHGKAKLTADQVAQARAMRPQGMTYAAIGKQLGASLWTIRDICQYWTRAFG